MGLLFLEKRISNCQPAAAEWPCLCGQNDTLAHLAHVHLSAQEASCKVHVIHFPGQRLVRDMTTLLFNCFTVSTDSPGHHKQGSTHALPHAMEQQLLLGTAWARKVPCPIHEIPGMDQISSPRREHLQPEILGKRKPVSMSSIFFFIQMNQKHTTV